MKGIKGFDKNLCCRGFQYEVGKTYELEGPLILCKHGFHYTETLSTTEYYYPLADLFTDYRTGSDIYTLSKNRYCEIEAVGDIVHDNCFGKFATNKIRIVRELSKEEILKDVIRWLPHRYYEREINKIIDYLSDTSEVEG